MKIETINLSTGAKVKFESRREKLEYDIKTISREMEQVAPLFDVLKKDMEFVNRYPKTVAEIDESMAMKAFPVWIMSILSFLAVIPFSLFQINGLVIASLIISLGVGFPILLVLSYSCRRQIWKLKWETKSTKSETANTIEMIMSVYNCTNQIVPVEYTEPKVMESLVYCSKLETVEEVEDIILMVSASDKNKKAIDLITPAFDEYRKNNIET